MIPNRQTAVILRAFSVENLLRGVRGVGDGVDRIPRHGEGTISLAFGNRATQAIGWATDISGTLRDPGRFHGHLVFFGAPEQAADVALRVIQEDTKQLAEAKQVFDRLADAVAAAAAFAPPYGPVVSAGCRLAKELGTALGTLVDDDLQLAFDGDLAALPSDAGTDGLHVLQRQTAGATGMALRFECREFDAEGVTPTDVRLVIRRAAFNLGREHGGQALRLEITANQAAGQAFKLELNLPPGEHIQEAIHVQGKTLFRGKWKGFMPFHASAATLPRPDAAKLAGALAKWEQAQPGVKSLAKALATLNDLDAADRKQFQDDLVDAHNVSQSLASLALEFYPEKAAVGIVSCLFRAADADHPHGQSAADGAIRYLAPNQEFDLCLGPAAGSHIRLTLALES